MHGFGVNARRRVRWVRDPPRRSFKQRVLVDRQRLMKNVAIDSTTVLELDAHGTDGALDATAHCNVLGNDVALDLCAIAYQEIRSAQLAFDPAEDLRWTIAFDVADNRHAGADAGAHSRLRGRLGLRRALFSDRVLLNPLANQDCARGDRDRNKCKPANEKGEMYGFWHTFLRASTTSGVEGLLAKGFEFRCSVFLSLNNEISLVS